MRNYSKKSIIIVSVHKSNSSHSMREEKTKGKRKNDKSKQMDESNKLNSGNFVGACYGALCGEFPAQGYNRADHRFYHQADRQGYQQKPESVS